MLAFVASLGLGLTLALAPQDQTTPRSDGWVTDRGNLLTDDQERALEALMESYRVGTTHEIALLTIESLEGRSLDAYALETAREWGIGVEGENNGALLLVSRDDRVMRIEVGRGLEGTLTDSVAGRIIRDVITPEFKRGEFYTGIRSGIEAMHAAIGGDYGPIERSEGGRRNAVGVGGCVTGAVNVLFILLFVGLLSGRRGGRGGRGGGLGGALPWIILASMGGGGRRGGLGGGGGGFGGGGGGGFGGFGGGGGFSGGGSSGGW